MRPGLEKWERSKKWSRPGNFLFLSCGGRPRTKNTLVLITVRFLQDTTRIIIVCLLFFCSLSPSLPPFAGQFFSSGHHHQFPRHDKKKVASMDDLAMVQKLGRFD
jgi:hypothetical protein